MASKPPKSVTTVVMSADVPLPPPQGANYFHFTVVGEEVQFLVGSINLLRVYEARGRGEPTVVRPEIAHRFLLSPMGFAALKSQVDEIAKAVAPSTVTVKPKNNKKRKQQ